MENRILVVQALDERELLIQKIMDKMETAQFLDYRKPQAECGCLSRLPLEALEREAQAALQQLRDWAARYERLSEAIAASNAQTYLETSRGRMSVAYALSLRNRLRGNSPYGDLTDFEGRLARRMKEQSAAVQDCLEALNGQTEGKSRHQAVLMDPLHVGESARRIRQERDEFLAELETKIKVSGATTYLTLEE